MRRVDLHSSKMFRSINQKIGLVKSKVRLSKKFKKFKPSSDLFTPIVSSFSPTTKQIFSRYSKPKMIDLARYSPRRNEKNRKLSQLPTREISRCIAIESAPHLKLRRHQARTIKPKPDKASEETARPQSAPSGVSNNTRFAEYVISRNPRFMKGGHSETKALESSKKLYDIDSKFPDAPKRRVIPKTQKKGKKKRINSTILIEGLPDTFSVNCDRRLVNDINPQLFGSLPSSSTPNTPADGEKQIKNYFTKKSTKAKKNRLMLEENERAKYFISKIPEKSLSRLKRKSRTPTSSNSLLKRNSSYIKNRNLYCETNVILEENPEVETPDFNRDLAKRKTEEIKKKFIGVRIRKESKLDRKTNDQREDFESQKSPVNESDNSSVSSRPYDESKPYHPESVVSPNAQEEKKPKRYSEEEYTRIFKKIRDDLDQNINLQEYVMGCCSKNDVKEFHKSLRRSFFTVLEDSQNNSSVYETCKSHLSEDNLFRDNSKSRQPPPTTPNNEENCNKTEEDETCRVIAEKRSSHQEKDEDSSYAERTQTSTLAKISEKLSTEEKTDTLQMSQLSSVGDVSKEIKDEAVVESCRESFIDQLCGINESDFILNGGNFVPLRHKSKKTPSISDTYIDQSTTRDVHSAGRNVKWKNNYETRTSRIEPDTDSGKAELCRKGKQLMLSDCRWKSVPSLSRRKSCPSNCSSVNSKKRKLLNKRANNVSSGSNVSDSVDSNMELLSDDSTYTPKKRLVTRTSRKHYVGASRGVSDTSSMTESASDLLEESRLALEKLMKCLNGPRCVSSARSSFNDILKDLAELENDDTFKRMIDERVGHNSSSLESMKKDNCPRNTEDIDGQTDDTLFLRIPSTEINSLKMDCLDNKPPSSTVVYFKSPSGSYRLSRESLPDKFDNIITCDAGVQ